MISIAPRASRRGLALFSFAVACAAALGARPPAPGMTYRVRIAMTPPDMPGMQMSPILIVGHGSAIGGQSRIDVDSLSGEVPLTVGDYMLTLDSGRLVTVSPSTKSYSDGASSMMAIPPQMLATPAADAASAKYHQCQRDERKARGRRADPGLCDGEGAPHHHVRPEHHGAGDERHECFGDVDGAATGRGHDSLRREHAKGAAR